MTVQAGIETVTDLEVLVGEFEEQACEHSQHDVDKNHHGGHATWYARAVSECCDKQGPIRAICTPFAAYALTDGPMVCGTCRRIGTARELTQLVEPINSTTR